MTKKYWLDWQKRIGETKNIELFNAFSHSEYKMKLSKVLNESAEEKLIKATFNKNTVDLIIERHRPKLNGIHVENEYKTLHREDIANIIFKKEG